MILFSLPSQRPLRLLIVPWMISVAMEEWTALLVLATKVPVSPCVIQFCDDKFNEEKVNVCVMESAIPHTVGSPISPTSTYGPSSVPSSASGMSLFHSTVCLDSIPLYVSIPFHCMFLFHSSVCLYSIPLYVSIPFHCYVSIPFHCYVLIPFQCMSLFHSTLLDVSTVTNVYLSLVV